MLRKSERASLSNAAIELQDFEQERLKDHVHKHDHYELVLILQGTGDFVLGEHTGIFRRGDLVLCPPNVAHAWRTSSETRASGVVLRFDPGHLPKSVLGLEEMAAVKRLIEKADQGLLLEVVDRERLNQRLRSIQRAQGALRLARLYVALELVATFNCTQLIGNKKNAGLRAATRAARLSSVRRYLEERLQQDVGRGEVARHLGMEEAAFSRYFHEATGATFVDYLANLRVRQAATMLSSRREMPLSEIAKRSGFSSLASFHRQFRRRIGTTPSAYRNAANAEFMEP